MVEVPFAVNGRNIHEQQVQFYRGDFIGGMTGDVYIGRISRNTIFLEAGAIIEEAFSGGTAQLVVRSSYGTETNIGDPIPLDTISDIPLEIPRSARWFAPQTREDYLRGCASEFDIILKILDVTTEESGLGTVYMTGIEQRISNAIFTQYPFQDTSRMTHIK